MAKRSERLLMWRLPICLTWSPFRQLYYSRALRYAVFRRADLHKDFCKFSPNFWNTLFSWIVSFLRLFLSLISFVVQFFTHSFADFSRSLRTFQGCHALPSHNTSVFLRNPKTLNPRPCCSCVFLQLSYINTLQCLH